jgi:hypothetical protein
MNYRDHPASESNDDVAGDLALFVSEATIAGPSFELEQPRDPLWDFPEEGPRSAATPPAVRKPSIYGPSRRSDMAMGAKAGTYGSLLAAVLIAAIAGAWWGRLIPGSRPIASAESTQPVGIAPVMKPREDASHLPAELMASVELRPSTRPPVASIVPTVAIEDTDRIENPRPKPVALSGAAPELRQPPQRAASMARGTSGGAASRPMPTLGPRTLTEPIPAAPMVAANSPVRSPAPKPPPAPEAPPVALPASSTLPAIAARPEPEALPSVVAARTEQNEIQRTLGQYRSAYGLLDAEAARAVWPSVDVRALARAFDSLTSQQLAFESCQFDIDGAAATAQCRGSATYTPKVGSRGPKLEARQWTFQLRKVDEGWKIQSAQTKQ